MTQTALVQHEGVPRRADLPKLSPEGETVAVMATTTGTGWDFSAAEAAKLASASRLATQFTPKALGLSQALSAIGPALAAQTALLQPTIDWMVSSKAIDLIPKIDVPLAAWAPVFSIVNSIADLPGMKIASQIGMDAAQMSSLVAGLSAAASPLAIQRKLGVFDTSWLMSGTTAMIIESGFKETSGTPLDSLGTLRKTLSRDTDVSAALDSAVAAVGSVGALGPDFTTIRARAHQLSDRIDRLDPEMRHDVDEALDAAACATHTASEGVLEQAATIGLDFARRERRSVGVLVAFTAGLGWLVCDLGEGNPLVPTTMFAAAGIGAGAYTWVVDKLKSPDAE